MFSHICKTYYPLFLPCCTYVSSVMRSSWHFNTSGFNVRFPRTPQNDFFFGKNIHQITSIFDILLSFGVILRCLWGLEAYIYTMFMSSVDQVYWFRATGGYICGCGRPSNLVYVTLQCDVTSLCHSPVWYHAERPYCSYVCDNNMRTILLYMYVWLS